MPDYQIVGQHLTLDGQTLLSSVGENITLVPDPCGVGVFLKFMASRPQSRLILPVGQTDNGKRFTACHRYEPFWMKPAAGTHLGQVPEETQYLLLELMSGDCLLIVPLIDSKMRSSLRGTGEDGLELVVESGDPGVVADSIVGLFVAVGMDPYMLMEQAAQSVQVWLGSGRLRKEKMLPDFIDEFGWCTWDSFYDQVTEEKVRWGLETFAAGGVQPRYMILDLGWQPLRRQASGEDRLSGFEADQEKFSHGLASTIQMAKNDFAIRNFLVWHAINGYWGGVDGEALPGYGVRSLERHYSSGILHHVPDYPDLFWGMVVGLVPPENSYRFFHDYHRYLRQQGVDGVKVDNQAVLETLAAGSGGRVNMMRTYHEALEGSVHTHFQGKLINCMSCSNEMLYSALNSNLTRTSTDFWPDRSESHGLHLYTNAQVDMWFAEFVHPDWDMFQSGHAMGAFHAAGRAVSGAPVYVSDKPEGHDFAVLRKLVLKDGRILRAHGVGRPTRDCLFHDPTREDVLLKIFNTNLEAGVLGVFNCRAGENAPTMSGAVCPTDVEGLQGETFAVYAHNSGALRLLQREEAWEFSLPPLGFEVFTIVPVHEGFAPLGLVDLYNSSGAIAARDVKGSGAVVTLLSGGRFLAYCARSPQQVRGGGDSLSVSYNPVTHRLEVQVPDHLTEVVVTF